MREAHPSPRRGGALAALAESFAHAWDGVVETAVHQRNMRIHLVAGLLVALLGSGIALPTGEQLALIVCVVLVLGGEVANSALEATIDLVSPEHHDRARAAKDAAAGGVLVLATGSVVVLAAVLARAWPALAAARLAALRQAALGLPLAADAALLLAPLRRPLPLEAALVLAGVGLLVALALCTANAVFTGLCALLFAVAAAAARRSRRERVILTHPPGST